MMKASTKKINLIYEVEYSRPAFSRIGAFVEQIEPIYDALSENLRVPSDAIIIQNENSIASAKIIVSLFSDSWIFESRLDGYKVQIFDLYDTDHFDLAVECTGKYSDAVAGFVSDTTPEFWNLRKSSWLSIDDDAVSAADFMDQFNPYGGNHDPFGIDSTNTDAHIIFECSNEEKFWNVAITLQKAIDPMASLFFDLSIVHSSGSKFEAADSQFQHLKSLSGAFSKKINLEIC